MLVVLSQKVENSSRHVSSHVQASPKYLSVITKHNHNTIKTKLIEIERTFEIKTKAKFFVIRRLTNTYLNMTFRIKGFNTSKTSVYHRNDVNIRCAIHMVFSCHVFNNVN